jgi:hypothetical protein
MGSGEREREYGVSGVYQYVVHQWNRTQYIRADVLVTHVLQSFFIFFAALVLIQQVCTLGKVQYPADRDVLRVI